MAEGSLSAAFTSWRELEQARNLVGVLGCLPPGGRLLVWCGNGHACKLARTGWTPMGANFPARRRS